MPQNYTPEFKKKIVRLRLEEGRTINSITTEYGISKESVRRWCNEFQKECQAQSLQIPSSVNEAEIMKAACACAGNWLKRKRRSFS